MKFTEKDKETVLSGLNKLKKFDSGKMMIGMMLDSLSKPDENDVEKMKAYNDRKEESEKKEKEAKEEKLKVNKEIDVLIAKITLMDL